MCGEDLGTLGANHLISSLPPEMVQPPVHSFIDAKQQVKTKKSTIPIGAICILFASMALLVFVVLLMIPRERDNIGEEAVYNSQTYANIPSPNPTPISTPMPTPTPTPTPLRVPSVSADSSQTMVIATDGSLWAWGLPRWYDGLEYQYSPAHFSTYSDWINITVSYSHSLGIRANGSLWAWGSNRDGIFGDGTATSSSYPVRIGIRYDWASVSVGYNFSLGIKNDVSLWAWGSNPDDMFGDGTTTSSSYSSTHWYSL